MPCTVLFNSLLTRLVTGKQHTAPPSTGSVLTLAECSVLRLGTRSHDCHGHCCGHMTLAFGWQICQGRDPDSQGLGALAQDA